MLDKSDEELSSFFSEDEPTLERINPFKSLESKMGVVENSTKLPNEKPSAIKKAVKEVKKEAVVSIGNTKDLLNDEAFEDKEYIRTKIKSLIDRLENQLGTLEESTLIGAEPRLFEVYATMAKTLADTITKLMDLQKQVSTSINNSNLIGEGSSKIVVEEKITRKVSASNYNDLLSEISGEN